MPIYVMLLVVGLVALFVFMASSPPNNQKPEVVQVKHNKATEAPQAKLDFALALPQESGLASIAASADGKHLALVGNVWSQKEQVNRTELSLFDLDSGKALWSVVYVNPNCCGLPIVKISPDGQLILGAGRKLHLYNKDGQELKVFSFQEDDEFALSGDLSSDGKYVAATSSHRAYLFSQNGQLLWASDFKDVPSVALSGDGTYLLVATSHAFQLFIEPQTSN
jgi:WD40 repeat protein